MAKDNLIAIATTTSYDLNTEEGRIRSKIAKEMIKNTVSEGYPIFVVDLNSTKGFVDEMISFGARVFFQEKNSAGSGRRQAIKQAYESLENYQMFLSTEPEKDLVGQGLLEKILKPLRLGKADIVIPIRTLKSLRSMPSIQRYTETAGNIFFEGLSGLRLDPWFGVRAWVRDITPGILEYNKDYVEDGEDTYSALHVPAVIKPFFDGRRIVTVPVDFIYPKTQVRFETNNPKYNHKRINQLIEVCSFSELAWKKYSLKRS